jgi:hypothetical protein
MRNLEIWREPIIWVRKRKKKQKEEVEEEEEEEYHETKIRKFSSMERIQLKPIESF